MQFKVLQLLPSCGTYILFLATSIKQLRHCFHTSLTHKHIIKDGPLSSEAVTSDSGDSR